STIAAFVFAFKKKLIEIPTVGAALAAFMALVISAIVLIPSGARLPIQVYTLFIGLASLAVLPLAAAPLALHWNRCRSQRSVCHAHDPAWACCVAAPRNSEASGRMEPSHLVLRFISQKTVI